MWWLFSAMNHNMSMDFTENWVNALKTKKWHSEIVYWAARKARTSYTESRTKSRWVEIESSIEIREFFFFFCSVRLSLQVNLCIILFLAALNPLLKYRSGGGILIPWLATYETKLDISYYFLRSWAPHAVRLRCDKTLSISLGDARDGGSHQSHKLIVKAKTGHNSF